MAAQLTTLPPWGQIVFGSKHYTADDVQILPDDGYIYEVYRGVLTRMPGTGYDHALICQLIGFILSQFFHGQGEFFRVVQNAGFDFTPPGDPPTTTMLVPDVAVMPSNMRLGPGIVQVPPMLVVEVASPSDSRNDLAKKAQFYLDNQVQEIWNVWPKGRTIDIWTPSGTFVSLDETQTLTSAVMPGFICLVKRCFDGI